VAYCTVADVERVLSAAGLAAREADDPAVSDDLLDEAASLVEEHVLPHYAAGDLSGNDWVTYCAADIAAFLWCERRGNPPPASIQAKYERRIKSLERVAANKTQIPGLARRRNSVPRLSNVRIKSGPVPHTVVERHRSPARERPQDYTQNTDPTERPADYRG
jgi:hypothetical protein